jgi:hypothetical protein
MNDIEVYGGKAKEREITEAVVYWCVKKLLPRVRTLSIEVRIKKLESAMGYCLNTDNHKTFELEINKGMSLFDLISTICHEMVHVKQYYRHELRQFEADGKVMWKTKVIGDNVDYTDLPWEKEAFKKECGLAIECFTQLDFSF